MKKTLLFFLLFSLALSLTACGDGTERKDISCEEILQAYEDAGYDVSHGVHRDDTDSTYQCYIKASISEEPGSDYIYFQTYPTVSAAEEAAETDKYNLIIWLYAAVSGETRWLKTGTYGKIEYSYYNSDLIQPFDELIK